MENDLTSILEQFSRLKVVVIGEAILDSSVRGKAGRLSLEAPVPVVQIQDGQEAPGGAANVAVNACRLGANVEFISVVGQDAEGDQLLDGLQSEGIEVQRVIRHPQRRTLLKRRIYAGTRLVVRYDAGSAGPVDPATGQRLLEELRAACQQADVMILSDYDQGLLTRQVLEGISRIQAEQPCALVVDTRRLEEYRGLRLDAVRPSYNRAMDMMDQRIPPPANLLEKLGEAGERILDMLDARLVAITLDEDGALVIDRETLTNRAYAPGVQINRVSGAGDAFISGLALGLAAGAQPGLAGEIASAVASIVSGKGGQAACCIDELREVLSGDRSKLVEDWVTLENRLDALREEGKKIVFTNGVFDILHSAHVAYLDQARSYGDILVIGVNTDESVQRLKGPTRPVNSLLERCRVLAGLSCVDYVVPFGEDNPINLIHHVRPDVYVKGGDYTRETLPEAAVVESYGGELRLVPYIANHSTTGVIERIRSIEEDKKVPAQARVRKNHKGHEEHKG